MDIDKTIGEHYGRIGLEESILAGLVALGRDTDHIDPEDIASVDELHVGGSDSVRVLAQNVGLVPGSRVLDVGSGLGGPARLYAREFGAIVDGIDVTPRFVSTATSLTARSGLAHAVTFTLGSALDMPFADAEFDAATMIHVGMNIRDKATLFQSVARVLKQGGMFAIFDFMVVGERLPKYPLPWADSADTSFLVSPDDYSSMLGDAGFGIDKQESWLKYALDVPEPMNPQNAEVEPTPVGLNLILGPNVSLRMENIAAAMAQGILAPIEILCHTEPQAL